jgi:hypothetical protein
VADPCQVATVGILISQSLTKKESSMQTVKYGVLAIVLVLSMVLGACAPGGEGSTVQPTPVPGKNTFELQYKIHVEEPDSNVDIEVGVKTSSEIYPYGAGE